MKGWRFGAVLMFVGACDLNPLTEAELFGPPKPVMTDAGTPVEPRQDAAFDAGTPDTAISPDLSPPGDASPSDLASEAGPLAPDGPRPTPIIITGHITACGVDVRARVRVFEDVTCSTATKGYLSLRVYLPPGQKVDLNVSKKGYITHTEPVVLEESGHIVQVDLKPMTGTCNPPPPTEDCSCPATEPGCQASPF